MKKVFFTPGPSQLFPTVETHLKQAIKDQILSISHRSKTYMEMHTGAVDVVRKILAVPPVYRIFFMGSATEAMERIIQNTVEKKSTHFVNGSFSERFFLVAKELGKSPQSVEVPWGEGFPADEKIDPDTELLCFTQNETSTGVALPMELIYAYHKKYPRMLIAMDIVSSVPYPVIDVQQLDIIFFSVQKGFGLPAGMGVLIVSPRAMEKAHYLRAKGVSIGSYHSFPEMAKYGDKSQTPETPNVEDIYLLQKVGADMLQIGMDQIRRRVASNADALYSFFTSQKIFPIFVQSRQFRSPTVIVVQTPQGSEKIISVLKAQQLVVGDGYGPYKGKQLRIANFPAHQTRDVKKLIRLLRSL